jgi:tRNA(Ile)-lysidine synthase
MIIGSIQIPIENFVVAISGGQDSLCLTMLANDFAVEHNLKMTAIFIDHNLQSETILNTKSIVNFLNKVGVRNKTLAWKHSVITGSIEKKARDARYRLLTTYCRENNIKNILVGHHILDQWETFFMRLARGSGLIGLCSMRETSTYNGINIIRPLLQYSPEDIKETFTQKFLCKTCVKDPMNQDEKYERVRWRKSYQLLSSTFGLNTTNIGKSIKRLQRANSCLNQMAQQYYNAIFDQNSFDLGIFCTLHEEIQCRILLKIIDVVSTHHSQGPISYSLLARTSYAICQNNFRAINISHCVFRKLSNTNKVMVQAEQRL